MSSKTFSQRVTITSKDTTICLTPNESKQLIKKIYEGKACFELKDVCERQKALKDSIINSQGVMIKDYSSLVVNNNQIISFKDGQIANLNSQIKTLNKVVIRQKTYKWIAIIAGAGVSGYFIYRSAIVK